MLTVTIYERVYKASHFLIWDWVTRGLMKGKSAKQIHI